MHGRRTRQASEGVLTQLRWGAGRCTPQPTHQAGTLRQDPSTETLCSKGTYGQGSCRVEQEGDKTSRGSDKGDKTGRKHR